MVILAWYVRWFNRDLHHKNSGVGSYTVVVRNQNVKNWPILNPSIKESMKFFSQISRGNEDKPLHPSFPFFTRYGHNNSAVLERKAVMNFDINLQ
jgi:hypothetical protein